jgi:hypothetical protein
MGAITAPPFVAPEDGRIIADAVRLSRLHALLHAITQMGLMEPDVLPIQLWVPTAGIFAGLTVDADRQRHGGADILRVLNFHGTVRTLHRIASYTKPVSQHIVSDMEKTLYVV